MAWHMRSMRSWPPQNDLSAGPEGGGEADDGGQLPLGQISIRANVSVTFDLVVADEPAKK